MAMDVMQSVFRWIHILAGILWIGHLYFFNFVNGQVAALLDADTKKKVVPELMPRALFWFRYGALFTWVTGVLLLMLVFYHGGLVFNDPTATWTGAAITSVVLTFAGVAIYEIVMKTVAKINPLAATAVGFALIAGFVVLMAEVAGFSYRAYVIHTGTLFGSIMAFNVWFRIWPAQQKIITAVKNGEKPDAELVALAGMRSKNNTYLSVPLVWSMINLHTTWASSHWAVWLVVILVGWHIVQHLYKRAGKLKGF